MADVYRPPQVVIVRDNGPIRVMGPADIVDALGAVIRHVPAGERQGLCRCAHSSDKPFCDGTHKKVGWRSVIRAADFGPSVAEDGREP